MGLSGCELADGSAKVVQFQKLELMARFSTLRNARCDLFYSPSPWMSGSEGKGEPRNGSGIRKLIDTLQLAYWPKRADERCYSEQSLLIYSSLQIYITAFGEEKRCPPTKLPETSEQERHTHVRTFAPCSLLIYFR